MNSEPTPELSASKTLSAVEKSRHEMLCNAACTLFDWNLPTEVIMEITGLPKADIESLRGAKAAATSQK
jgi:hypothetical protein